jgi:hypothetical protein
MTTQDLQRNSLICESLSLMKNRALSTHGDGTGKKPLSFSGPNRKNNHCNTVIIDWWRRAESERLLGEEAL